MADVYACRNCDEVTISENKPLACQHCGGAALTKIYGVQVNVISEKPGDDNSEELDILERTYRA
jgi:DNA-directed RNA polymerase subunit RPC12/RpoP